MSTMTSQILKFKDSSKTQKTKYLEKKTIFFLQIKKNYSLYIKSYNIAKKNFIAEVTVKFHRIFKQDLNIAPRLTQPFVLPRSIK